MATYPVKYFHDQMRSAPVLNGTAGALLGLLDACLGTGFGLVSVTGISVTGGVATATVSSGNSFEEGAIVLIAGATPAELNGEARVLSATSTSFTFATEAADGAASGSITAKYAPCHNWQKVFSGTNKAVWKSIDPQANGHFLRVDDSAAQSARVVGYEQMTDVDTGTGPFPTPAQVSGGWHWYKSSFSNANPVRWWLFADARFVVLAIATQSGSNATFLATAARGFGDPIALAPGGDSWSTLLCGASVAPTAGAHTSGTLVGGGAATFGSGIVMCRALSGLGSATLMQSRPEVGGVSRTSGVDQDGFGQFPSEVDGVLRLSRVFSATSSTNAPPRAIHPGVWYAPHTGVVDSGIVPGDVLIGSGDLLGRRLVAVGTTSSSLSGAPGGMYFVDATGPWRDEP